MIHSGNSSLCASIGLPGVFHLGTEDLWVAWAAWESDSDIPPFWDSTLLPNTPGATHNSCHSFRTFYLWSKTQHPWQWQPKETRLPQACPGHQATKVLRREFRASPTGQFWGHPKMSGGSLMPFPTRKLLALSPQRASWPRTRTGWHLHSKCWLHSHITAWTRVSHCFLPAFHILPLGQATCLGHGIRSISWDLSCPFWDRLKYYAVCHWW